MKRTCIAIVVISIVLSVSLALAGQPYGTNWGKWGPKDQLGAWNYITPEKTAAAAKLVKKGKIFNLAIDLKPNQPGWTGRWYRHTFDYILPALDPAGGIGFADDAITMHQQYSTQWDGFPHSFYSGKMYNGYDAAKVTALGTAELSIHQWADKIATRGILLDIAKYKGVDNLEKGYVITPEDLEAARAEIKQQVDDAREVLAAFDTVVLALGAEPENRLARELAGKVAEIHVIGDAQQPGGALAAIAAGSEVGRRL